MNSKTFKNKDASIEVLNNSLETVINVWWNSDPDHGVTFTFTPKQTQLFIDHLTQLQVEFKVE